MLYLVAFSLLSGGLLLLAWMRHRQWSLRARRLRALLDGADALEASVQQCRERMQRIKSMLAVLPDEMSADALTALSAEDKFQAALRDLLAHRLWIRDRAQAATMTQLQAADAAIEQSRRLLESQLGRLEAVADELGRAQSDARVISRPNR